MENFYSGYSSLELTIAIPGFSSPSLLSSGESGGSTMKEVDINQVPTSRTEEECMEEEGEEEDDEMGPINGGGPARRKKLRLTKEQSRLLEESFRQNHTLNPREKETLAGILRLKPRQVEVWFQNRRARSKLKQTEMECEYLKRWFRSLSDQNRKLHKEVEELRAIKVGAGHRLSPPPSALTMCPRCQRVTATAATTITSTNISHLRHRPQPPASCYN